jgi:hypothetical protein
MKQKNAVLCSDINLYNSGFKHSMHSVHSCSEVRIVDVFSAFPKKS